MFDNERVLVSLLKFGGAILTLLFGSGVYFKLRDALKDQRDLVTILINLQNESKFNEIHRGDQLRPFQSSCLEKALHNSCFHEQCADLSKICLDVSELVKDANLGNLKFRKLVPRDVQEKMEIIAMKIDMIIPHIKKRTELKGYILWRLKNILGI